MDRIERVAHISNLDLKRFEGRNRRNVREGLVCDGMHPAAYAVLAEAFVPD